MTEKAALEQLQAAYRGTSIEIRFYGACTTVMRWQLGANGDGHFRLLAYGPTPEKLLECVQRCARLQGQR